MPSTKLSDLTYSAPCTACGEADHDRTSCEHAASVVVTEINDPMGGGWDAVSTYPDGRVSRGQLTYDRYNDRLSLYGVLSPSGRWAMMPWRGRQPIERGIKGARAYALAFFYGADLPATEDPR